ncbi:uncharacterized protein isoform X2 [Rhodnius prolixus]|uniref:uncharacterized protein isoform X2 n=1 Tax=Rhodnius prolixus TaxID=13249 RepID=UPI003D18AC2B
MVKRSVTLLEETIFQHVTIHKLMIYIYDKLKVCQDPFLAIIRSNIVELKKIRGCDPVVLLESSKTIMKTLVTFTRLSCISPEVVGFIRRLMHDVYVRMRKLWETYKIHGSYEVPKKRQRVYHHENLLDKENLETSRQVKKNEKTKNSMKKLTEELSKTESNYNNDNKEAKNVESDKFDADIASQIRDSVVSELASDGSFCKNSLLERIKTIITENHEKPGEDDVSDDLKNSDSMSEQKDFKSPKKRKVKNRKWSLGIIHAKKKKKVDISNIKVEVKQEVKSTILPEESVDLAQNLENKTELIAKKFEMKTISQPKDFEDEETSLNTCNVITKDSGWEERLRVQREYYLNEMSKVSYRLNAKLSPLPNYNFINVLTKKMNISLTTYGHAIKELMAMDHAQLIESNKNNESSTSYIDLWKIEPNPSNSINVGVFKATRHRKRFIYECTGEKCSVKTIHLSVLYNHAVLVHSPFNWDWSCSMCGIVQQINLLQNANLLDMAMYHLLSYHSTSALSRNPEIASMEMQIKTKAESPLNIKTNLTCGGTNSGISRTYCSQLFKCSKCSFSSGLFSEGLSHFSIEYQGNAEFKCIYCSQGEKSVYDLCNHMELYHSSSIFLCSQCHYRSVSPINTLNHYYDEHDEGDESKEILIYVNVEPASSKNKPLPTVYPSSALKKYICNHPDNEDFRTMIGSKFVKHLTTCPSQGGKRNNGSNRKFECSLCGTKTVAAYKLKQHFEAHQVLRYICVYCGQGYIKLLPLEEHFYKTHMYWHPRYIIREAYDDCPKELSEEYSSMMKYETDLEDLLEVSLEMKEFHTQSPRIKLQMISGDPWPGFYEVSEKPQEKNRDNSLLNLSVTEESFKTESMLQENSISEGKDSQVETFVEEQLNPDKEPNRLEELRGKENNSDVIDLTEDETPAAIEKESKKKSMPASYVDEIIEILSDSEDKNDSLLKNQKLIASPQKNKYSNSVLKSSIKIAKESLADNSLRQFRFSRSSVAPPSIGYIVTSPRTSKTTPTTSFDDRLPSCSPIVVTPEQHSTGEITCSAREPTRTPEIRVIAEAKLDNFMNSLFLGNPPPPDRLDKKFLSDKNHLELYGKDGNESGPSASSVTVPNILKKKKTESKSKMIQILKVCKENKSSQGIILFKCPYCKFAGQDKSGLSQHISRMHTDIVNSSSVEVAKDFKCAKCQTSFEGFALLHKHVETSHEQDTIGAFQIFVEGNVFVRKDVKICFLCSALIVSLEQLYNHPDVCPFAHTTGTHLNSSIVYATGNKYKAVFAYQKSEIKINRNIVELLQPHLPTPVEANIVKRAVAKKSTGPRPQIQEAVTSQVGSIRRAVARKSTGPYVMPSPSIEIDHLI